MSIKSESRVILGGHTFNIVSANHRGNFSRCTAPYFPKGINRLEINSISVELTARWRPQIESYRVATGERKMNLAL